MKNLFRPSQWSHERDVVFVGMCYALIVTSAFALLLLAGCSSPAKTSIKGPTASAERREVGPSRRTIRIEPPARPLRADPRDTAPYWSPEHSHPTGDAPADGWWDVAGAAVQRGGTVIIEEEYDGTVDAKGTSDAGSIDTASDEVAAKGSLTGAPVDIAPLGSKKSSGSRRGGESSFDVTAALAQDVTLLYLLGALFMGVAGVAYWFTRSLVLAGSLAVAGGGVLLFATSPGLGAAVLVGSLAVAALLLIPAARKWGEQKTGLSALVRGVEQVSDKSNPQSAGMILKAALDQQLDSQTLASIDKAIDPIKAGKF